MNSKLTILVFFVFTFFVSSCKDDSDDNGKGGQTSSLPQPILDIPISNNLEDVGFYKLGKLETEGEFADDRNGNANSAIELFGRAKDYIKIPFNANLQNKDVTVALWVKMNGAPKTTDVLWHIVSNFNSDDGEWGDVVWVKPNELGTSVGAGVSNRLQMASVSNSESRGIHDNKWHHVVGAYDYAANAVRIYIDGELLGENTAVGSQGGFNSSDEIGWKRGYSWVIGAHADLAMGTNNVTKHNFIGLVDDIKIYDVALSTKQIKELFTN